jgi:hypothetical protein
VRSGQYHQGCLITSRGVPRHGAGRQNQERNIRHLDQGLGSGLEHKGRRAENLGQSETMQDMDPEEARNTCGAASARKEVHKQDYTNHGDFHHIVRNGGRHYGLVAVPCCSVCIGEPDTPHALSSVRALYMYTHAVDIVNPGCSSMGPRR